MEKEDRDEGKGSERPHDFVFERFAANANDRDGHDGHHGRFQSVKDCRHPRHVTKSGVDITKCPQDKDGWNNEERAGDDTAPGLVQKPADIGSKLLRLGTRQEHAVIQRVQKSRLTDPFLLLHQLSLHNCDLAGRSAETDETEFDPKASSLSTAWSKLSILRRSWFLKLHRHCINEYSASKRSKPRRKISSSGRSCLAQPFKIRSMPTHSTR